MKKMELIKVNGSGATNVKVYLVNDWENHEGFVRGIMCWYSDGTKFIVKDTESGEIQVFEKVANNDPITGYTELIRHTNFTKLEDMFEILETEE